MCRSFPPSICPASGDATRPKITSVPHPTQRPKPKQPPCPPNPLWWLSRATMKPPKSTHLLRPSGTTVPQPDTPSSHHGCNQPQQASERSKSLTSPWGHVRMVPLTGSHETKTKTVPGSQLRGTGRGVGRQAELKRAANRSSPVTRRFGCFGVGRAWMHPRSGPRWPYRRAGAISDMQTTAHLLYSARWATRHHDR